MEQMVTDPSVDKVLIVCDSKYKEKAGRIHVPEVELMINCIANDTTQEKFFALSKKTMTAKAVCICVAFYIVSSVKVQ